MLRKKKRFEWPRKLYDKPRILDENRLVARYGLKNKKEIWKVQAKIDYFRNRAKELITADSEEQQKFFDNLSKIGLKVDSIADVLALNTEDLLKRRLPSVIVSKKLANTPKQARQMVTHKRILVNGDVVNVPSYTVKVVEESSIGIKKKSKKQKPVEEPAQEGERLEEVNENASEENQENIVEEEKNNGQ